MFNDLLEALRGALFQRWNGRLEGIRAGAEQAESSGLTVAEAYSHAYQAAYFDAVADMVDEGFIAEPAPVSSKTTPFAMSQLTDDIH